MITITGTKGNDILRDYEPDNTSWLVPRRILGLGGDDTITAYGGGDYLSGGTGNDVIELDYIDTFSIRREFVSFGKLVSTRNPVGSDEIDAGPGDDVVKIGSGESTIKGGTGYDTLTLGYIGGQYNQPSSPYISTRTVDDTARVYIDLQAGTLRYAGKIVSSDVWYYQTQGDGSRLRVDVGTFSAIGLGKMDHRIEGFEAVIGTQYADVIRGSDRTDVIEVFEKGQFSLNNTNDKIIGRGGMDVASFAGSYYHSLTANLAKRTVEGVVISSASGSAYEVLPFTDVLSGIEGIYGTRNDDRLTGDAGANIFNGRAGDDRIDGRGGLDTVSYNTGPMGRNSPDVYLLDGTGGVTVDLDDGEATDDFGDTDTLINIENVIGSLQDDMIRGDDKKNQLDGSGGMDTLEGGGGNDTLNGGDGNDKLDGGDGVDILNGQDGDDILKGGEGNDILKGGKGTDRINGGADRDLIFGDDGPKAAKDAGNDILSGDGGNDTIYGYRGEDTLNGGTGDDELYGGKDKDVLNGGKNDDELYGEGGNDELYGGKHKDTLDGGVGNDILDGGAGNDTFVPGLGVDILRGGSGFDTLDLTAATSKVTINLTTRDFNGGGFGRNTIRDIERIFGSDQVEVITGSSADETFYGGGGRDILDGAGGNDTIVGGAGKDHLKGGDGEDKLIGDQGVNSGNDVLEGGDGDDELYGNGGNDILKGGADDDILDGGAGRDKLTGGGGGDTFVFGRDKTTVTDFDRDADVIDVSGHGFATALLAYAALSDDGKGNAVMTANGDVLLLEGIIAANLNFSHFEI